MIPYFRTKRVENADGSGSIEWKWTIYAGPTFDAAAQNIAITIFYLGTVI